MSSNISVVFPNLTSHFQLCGRLRISRHFSFFWFPYFDSTYISTDKAILIKVSTSSSNISVFFSYSSTDFLPSGCLSTFSPQSPSPMLPSASLDSFPHRRVVQTKVRRVSPSILPVNATTTTPVFFESVFTFTIFSFSSPDQMTLSRPASNLRPSSCPPLPFVLSFLPPFHFAYSVSLSV